MKEKISRNRCEKESPQPKIPHMTSDQNRELRDSTKREEERVLHKIRERSEPPHDIPPNLSGKIIEICDPPPEIPKIADRKSVV